MSLLPIVLLAPAAFAADPDQVTMDLGQFLQLYESSKDRPVKPQPAPRAFSIASARYDGTVVLEDNEPVSARFTGRLHIEVLEDKEWVKIPLLPVTVALESAKIGNTEASVVLEDGWYTLVTQKRGGFDVDIAFAASVETYVGASGVAFELAPSGGTVVELGVPSSDALDFTVANAKLETDRFENGKRIVTATLPATGSLSVTWQREIRAEQQQAARVYSQVYTLVGIGDGVMHATSTIEDTILFAGIDEVKVQVPEQMTLLDVRGTGIRDWSVGDDRVLTVELNYAAEGAYSLTLDMERVVGEGSVDLTAPLVVPIGVERSKGFVGVEARGNLEITGGTPKNATNVDVRTLPAAILGITENPVLLGYKYLGTDVSVPLTVSQHENVDVLLTIIDQERGTTMFTAEGRRITSVTYDVRNNRRQFLRLALPDGAELWSAAVAGRAVQPAKASDGRVMIPLVRSQESGGALAAFAVEVVYVEEGTAPKNGAGDFVGTLPTADVPATYVGWTVYAPSDAKVKKSSFDGSLRDVDYLTFPNGTSQVMTIDTYTEQVQTGAEQQVANGALGQGGAPVPVRLPLEGTPYYFEKVLALDEKLWVGFGYHGLD